MRETNFIQQNKEKWNEFEDVLHSDKKDPDKLSDLFVQVTDDLSYSRTFYPNRYVRVYLNNLAQRIFLNVYKNKKEKRGHIFRFWRDELPLEMYRSRKELLFAFVLFMIAVAIGVFSSMHDPEFARLILGDSYVNMTEEYIRSGDPMKVYKTENGFDMFLGITFNNLYVAFLTFIFGILYAAGTCLMLLYNGVMVGVFQYFFIEHGLFRESFLTIWMHGTLEISSIIIAGSAGIVMGKGLIFPGTYTRFQSLQMSARRAFKIVLGLVPVFITAAIIESFFTRYTDVTDIVRLAVILISLFFILAYFVWLPLKKGRETKTKPEEKLSAVRQQPLDFTAVRNNGEIFGDLFVFFRQFAARILALALLIGVSLAIIFWVTNPDGWRSTYLFSGYAYMNLHWYFGGDATAFWLHTFGFAVVATFVFYWVKREAIIQYKMELPNREKGKLFFIRNFYKAILASALINLFQLLPPQFMWLALLFLFPSGMNWLALMLLQNMNPIAAAGKLFQSVAKYYLRMLGLMLILSLVCVILFFFLDSPIIWIFVEVIKSNFLLSQEFVNTLYTFIMRATTLMIIYLLLPMLMSGFALQYFSMQEMETAHFLKERIARIGIKQIKTNSK